MVTTYDDPQIQFIPVAPRNFFYKIIFWQLAFVNEAIKCSSMHSIHNMEIAAIFSCTIPTTVFYKNSVKNIIYQSFFENLPSFLWLFLGHFYRLLAGLFRVPSPNLMYVELQTVLCNGIQRLAKFRNFYFLILGGPGPPVPYRGWYLMLIFIQNCK